MRSYLIDELSLSDLAKIEGFLKLNTTESALGKIFWVSVPPHLLSPIQAQHTQCQPHVISAELGTNWIKFELYVRSRNAVGCECQGYCTCQQEQFLLKWAREAMRNLDVAT